MERFVIIVNGWKPLTIITKRSILGVAAALDPPLMSLPKFWSISLLEILQLLPALFSRIFFLRYIYLELLIIEVVFFHYT